LHFFIKGRRNIFIEKMIRPDADLPHQKEEIDAVTVDVYITGSFDKFNSAIDRRTNHEKLRGSFQSINDDIVPLIPGLFDVSCNLCG
jgi:hypothetical protein